MNRGLLQLILNVAGLYLAVKLVPGIVHSGEWWTLVVIAVIFGLVNTFIRPLVMGISCLLNLVTFGLFTLVVNALMLLLTDWLSDRLVEAIPSLNFRFDIDGFLAALLGAIVITIFSMVMHVFVRENRRRR